MPPNGGRPAGRVAAGILLTRLLGLVRERVFAHYFGSGVQADAFRAALKIPNTVRNLLGEGTLSASFIPVYAGLLEGRDEETARRVAGTILSLLVLLTGAGALAGIALAPVITDAVAIGFSGETRDLTITLVRVLFPMAGVMILAAWCLGILNTHGRFFLSYAAPALWNIVQIGTLVTLGGVLAGSRLVVALAWGALAGSTLQVAVQLPTTLARVGRIRWNLDLADPPVKRVVTAWLPVVFGAGVMQISSIIDTQLGSLAGPGSVATLGYAQLIALLPISLFGVSVAAAALPDLSRDAARDASAALRRRVGDGGQRVLFFVIPSAFAFVVLGRHLVGPLLQTGEFGPTQTELVATVLAAYGLGLPAQAIIKLLTSSHYALGDTRTPVRIAMLSVPLSAGLAVAFMQIYGVAGIALGGSIAAYLNAALNYRALARRVGPLLARGDRRAIGSAILSSLLAAVAGWGVDQLIPAGQVWGGAVLVVGVFTMVYISSAAVLGHPEVRRLVAR